MKKLICVAMLCVAVSAYSDSHYRPWMSDYLRLMGDYYALPDVGNQIPYIDTFRLPITITSVTAEAEKVIKQLETTVLQFKTKVCLSGVKPSKVTVTVGTEPIKLEAEYTISDICDSPLPGTSTG